MSFLNAVDARRNDIYGRKSQSATMKTTNSAEGDTSNSVFVFSRNNAPPQQKERTYEPIH